MGKEALSIYKVEPYDKFSEHEVGKQHSSAPRPSPIIQIDAPDTNYFDVCIPHLVLLRTIESSG